MWLVCPQLNTGNVHHGAKCKGCLDSVISLTTLKVTGYCKVGIVWDKTFFFSCQRAKTTLQLEKLLWFYSLIFAQETPRIYLIHTHTHTVSYSWFYFQHFLNFCIATWGVFLVIPSLQDCRGTGGSFFFLILKGCQNIQSLLRKRLLGLTQCNFVTSNDFIKASLCPSSILS